MARSDAAAGVDGADADARGAPRVGGYAQAGDRARARARPTRGATLVAHDDGGGDDDDDFGGSGGGGAERAATRTGGSARTDVDSEPSIVALLAAANFAGPDSRSELGGGGADGGRGALAAAPPQPPQLPGHAPHHHEHLHLLQPHHPPLPVPSSSSGPEFVRGAAAAVTAVALTFPLNKLMSRQAYEGLTVGAAAETLRADGMRHLYRGVGPPLASKALSLGLMYGAYDWYTLQLCAALLPPPGEGGASPAAVAGGGEGAAPPAARAPAHIRVAAALLAGATEAALTPFERVQTVLQHRHYTGAYANGADVAAKLARHGPRELYRGVSAILLRNGPSNAVFFMLREPVRDALTPRVAAGGGGGGGGGVAGGAFHDVLRDFLAGAVLGAGISTAFYPLNLAKSVMQLRIGGEHASVAATLRDVYRDRGGVGGLYRGVAANALRSLLSWGIVNASYEVYRKLLPWGHERGGGGGGAARARATAGAPAAVGAGAALLDGVR